MPMTDEEEKALRKELAEAKALAAEAQKNARTPEEKDEVAQLKAKLEKATADLEAAKKNAPEGGIRAASEESVHAVLEVAKELKAELAKKGEPDESVRWSAW